MNGTVTKPSVPSSFRRASCSQLVEGRLAEARRLGRRWRLRFQLPLGIAGVAIATVSIVGGWTTGKTALGGYGICGGPWLLLCCVLPTETRAIAAAIVCVSLCSATCAVYHALALGFILDGAAAATASAAGELCAPPRDASYGCASFRAISAYAVAILVVFTLLFIFLGVALYGSTSRSSWLPARPPRATLDSLWRLSGSVLIAYACVWIAFGIVELREPIYDLNIFSAREAEYSVADRVAIRFSLAFEMLVLSVLALWPGMRGFVQSRFAARGEGIVAAAGISELIGSCPTAELLARAERTFRSVRLDQLERHHLDSNKPAIEAYAISTRTALGSIDAFLSHSWHDDPTEKWSLLQAWRGRFVHAHGREPTIWFDRCCLDPTDLNALLPCLPIFLAGCDTLLALRGSTYLNRLWCVVELFVFQEMRAGKLRIEINDFAGSAPYTRHGLPVEQPHGPPPLSTVRMPSRPRVQISPAELDGGTRYARFDVRDATCSKTEDADALLAVIETCGAGFDSFNQWMHDLLVDTPREPVRRGSTALLRASPREPASRSSTPSMPRASADSGNLLITSARALSASFRGKT